MEGGAEESAFRECFSLAWRNPYVLRLAFSAGIGGLLLGYDTGVISGALLYIRDDFNAVDEKTVLQETIVSMAVAGAIIGAAFGGWLNDRFGRKFSLLVVDFLFFIGALLMGTAPNPAVLIVGRFFIGLAVGMASMTAPLYISEASPAKIRGALVSINGFLIAGGQFLSYPLNIAFTKVPGTWRWMLGVAWLPALLQFVLMLALPESPRWLYRKGREEEAERILRKIYPTEVVKEEIEALKESIEKEIKETESVEKINVIKLLKTKTVRRGLIIGVGLQIFQQFSPVMYYSPTIIQLAGIALNQTALLLSLMTAGLNVLGSIVSIYFIDWIGRKKLMVISLVGVALSLGLLSAVFHETVTYSPPVSGIATAHFGNATCPGFGSPGASATWDCMKCLKASPSCGFCADASNKLLPGACLIFNHAAEVVCHSEDRLWYTQGCPTRFWWLALLGLALYVIFFSSGMGTAPWIVNSEIYPLRFRGVCGGIAATANWISNLIVAQFFLSLTEAIGTSWTFLIFGVISVVALVFVLVFVPETKGLLIEDVEKMLEVRAFRFKFWVKIPETEVSKKISRV